MGRTWPSDSDGSPVRAAQGIVRPVRPALRRPFGTGYPPIPVRPEPSVPYFATASNAGSITHLSGASGRRFPLSLTTVGGSAAVDNGDDAVAGDIPLIRHV